MHSTSSPPRLCFSFTVEINVARFQLAFNRFTLETHRLYFRWKTSLTNFCDCNDIFFTNGFIRDNKLFVYDMKFSFKSKNFKENFPWLLFKTLPCNIIKTHAIHVYLLTFFNVYISSSKYIIKLNIDSKLKMRVEVKSEWCSYNESQWYEN